LKKFFPATHVLPLKQRLGEQLASRVESMNAYLCIYFRKLKPGIRIVSRITHERNIESIHRAGSDFALSYSSLGQELVLAFLQGREFIFLGSDIDFHVLDIPASMAGRTLREIDIGARTGLNVIAVEHGDRVILPGPDTELPAGAHLVALGTAGQIGEMKRVFG
jgi:Trk K+ transport system NAD-binding subunit